MALGGEEISREELERLAALKEPLVRLRGQWVEIQPEQAQAALRCWTHAPERLTLGEALRTAATGELTEGGGETLELEEISADGWIGDLLGRLRGVSTDRRSRPAEGLPRRTTALPATGSKLAQLLDAVRAGSLPRRRHGFGQNG